MASRVLCQDLRVGLELGHYRIVEILPPGTLSDESARSRTDLKMTELAVRRKSVMQHSNSPLRSHALFLLVLLFATAVTLPVLAQKTAVPPSLITGAIDENQLVTLKGNLHPAAIAANDRGIVDDGEPLGHVILLLNRAPELEKQLAAMIDQLHNSKSPKYHQWLTAEQFGEQYGLSDADLKTVTDWLQAKGFMIEDVPPGRTHIVFTGTVGQIRSAFHTEIHKINVHGELHRANISEPQVPAALAPVIRGFWQLTDFRAKPLLVNEGAVRHNSKTGRWERASTPGVAPGITFTYDSCTSLYDSCTFYAVTPQDFYTIYNENPVLSSDINGAGVTIAVLEETEVVNQSDVASFRSQFGLAAYPATPNSSQGGVNWMYGPGHGCTAPPVSTSPYDEEGEGLLDVEWAGAVAPNAIVDFVACKSTGGIGSYGIDLAASYVLNYLYSTVSATSLSYGLCEIQTGSSGASFYSALGQQGAAEGITHVVSSMDAGSAVCDMNAKEGALNNISVNAMASTAYNVSAGGTDFGDVYTTRGYVTSPASTWWNTNDTSPYGSALSYLPEITWGGYCSNPLLVSYLQATDNTEFGTTYTPVAICNNATAIAAGGLTVKGGSGGVSAYNALPTWQSVYGIGPTGNNNTSTTFRNQPDVSLFAANGLWNHFLLYCNSDPSDPFSGVSACTFSNSADAYALSGGGTSFVAPQLAGLMALIVQKTGQRQGVANYTLYGLAAQEYGTTNAPNTSTLATCSGSAKGAAVGSSCIFRDISNDTPSLQGGTIASDIAQPCNFADVATCWEPSSMTYGITSVGNHPSTENDAYVSSPGYDLATGLGSVNISNLVNNWNTLSPGFATSTANSANPTVIGLVPGTTTLTATVTETGRGGAAPPAGTVTFYIGSTSGTNLGSAPLTASVSPTNQATGSLLVNSSALQSGANQIIAYFPGDGANDAPSTSSAVTVTLNTSPGIYSPVNSSTLSGISAVFQWNGYTGATAYWLDVGKVQGGNYYYQSGSLPTSTLSQTVNSLPEDGSTVWARWYYLLSGAWQHIDYTYTAFNAAAAAAVMQTPAPSSTLSGGSVTFDWTAGTGATAYWLDVGSVAGGNQYEQSGNLGNVLTTTVNGLPTDGSTVYVTLYSLAGGVWVSNAYTYKAFNAAAAAAGMTSPTGGSTLTGSSVTFQWGAASGASGYWLDVGTVEYGNTIYQSGTLSNTVLSQTVNGLPTDDSTVYVTLYTKFKGIKVVNNEYSYTAFNAAAAAAVMQTPTPGSTLTANRVTFNWTAGTGASAYWLDIGTSPGGNTIYQSGNLGTVLTTTAPNMQATGLTVYATLYSLVGGQWVSNSYTYKAAPGAVMSTPVPGTTLSGTSVTFNWNAGTGFTSYELIVGSTYGGSNLYSSGTITTLSTTASGLPANGSTIYVTLYSVNGGQTVQNYYSYVSGP